MNFGAVSCTFCAAPIANPASFNTGEFAACPRCGARQRIELFPAFFREEVQGQRPENLVGEGESSCYYHPTKKAEIPCELCGRFLCALCDVELNGQHLCPVCLERGQQKRTLKHLENQRVRFDNLALLIALGPVLIWPFTILTAPGAIYFSIRHWNSPTGLMRPSRVRFVAAIVLGALQVAAWIVGLSYAFTR
jgi:hypothetical protein